MKKIFLSIIAASLTTFSLFAQDFEGSIKYNIAMTGPGMDAQKGMLPTAYNITVKGNNSKFVMEGGMLSSLMGDIIYRGDEKASYMVNHTTKTANRLKKEENNDEKKPDVKVTKESGTAKILGYDCQKYKVVSKDESGAEQTVFLWAAKDIKINSANKSKTPGGGLGQFMFDGVEGFPLKMEIKAKVQGSEILTTVTATKVDLSKVSDAAISVPKDYKIEEGLPEILKMLGGGDMK